MGEVLFYQHANEEFGLQLQYSNLKLCFLIVYIWEVMSALFSQQFVMEVQVYAKELLKLKQILMQMPFSMLTGRTERLKKS